MRLFHVLLHRPGSHPFPHLTIGSIFLPFVTLICFSDTPLYAVLRLRDSAFITYTRSDGSCTLLLKALEDAGVLAKVRRIAGTSAGAICAGLLSVGCTPQEIADVFKGDVKRLFHGEPIYRVQSRLVYFV